MEPNSGFHSRSVGSYDVPAERRGRSAAAMSTRLSLALRGNTERWSADSHDDRARPTGAPNGVVPKAGQSQTQARGRQGTCQREAPDHPYLGSMLPMLL